VNSARFERRARLADKADFQRVFERPERSADGWFTVLARSNTLGFSRLGMAISVKVAQSAVQRNRIKRVVRESFRINRHKLASIDVVVIGRSDLAKQNNKTISDSLQRHWKKLVKRCAQS
jgi:ribonuclease P protein component